MCLDTSANDCISTYRLLTYITNSDTADFYSRMGMRRGSGDATDMLTVQLYEDGDIGEPTFSMRFDHDEDSDDSARDTKSHIDFGEMNFSAIRNVNELDIVWLEVIEN